MNAPQFEDAKARVREDRFVADEIAAEATPEQMEELVRIIREEVGHVHQETSARGLYDGP